MKWIILDVQDAFVAAQLDFCLRHPEIYIPVLMASILQTRAGAEPGSSSNLTLVSSQSGFI